MRLVSEKTSNREQEQWFFSLPLFPCQAFPCSGKLKPTLSFSPFSYLIIFICGFFSCRAGAFVNQKNSRLHEKFISCSFSPSKLASSDGFCRRDLLLFGLSSSLSLLFPFSGWHFFFIFYFNGELRILSAYIILLSFSFMASWPSFHFAQSFPIKVADAL